MLQNLWFVSIVIILIWGTIPIMLKSLTTKYPSHIIMLTTSIMFGIVAFSVAIFCSRDMIGHAKAFTKKDWMMMFYIVVAGSLISNMLYMYALELHDSAVVVAVTSIFPIVTLMLGAYLFKYRVTRIMFVGIVLVTVGIMCLTYAMNNQK